ncbi:hypothetical protein CVS40_10936 [Lucilia cuprina]|nr:hypothetical protein CVS40_10936 [Lucilia cuprina]
MDSWLDYSKWTIVESWLQIWKSTSRLFLTRPELNPYFFAHAWTNFIQRTFFEQQTLRNRSPFG